MLNDFIIEQVNRREKQKKQDRQYIQPTLELPIPDSILESNPELIKEEPGILIIEVL